MPSDISKNVQSFRFVEKHVMLHKKMGTLPLFSVTSLSLVEFQFEFSSYISLACQLPSNMYAHPPDFR